jgi:hypothetical protein
MSLYRHIPRPPLDQHVAWLWYYADFKPGHDREHVLPDGTFDLIINLEDRPRKLLIVKMRANSIPLSGVGSPALKRSF